jgi:hypothetical protein
MERRELGTAGIGWTRVTTGAQLARGLVNPAIDSFSISSQLSSSASPPHCARSVHRTSSSGTRRVAK